MGFEFFQKKEETDETIELDEKLVLEKLNSLGIKYKYKNIDGKLTYTFLNVQDAGGGAFLLDAGGKKIIFQTFHLDDGKFKDPVNKNETSFGDLSRSVSEKFLDADSIIYSCCYPKDARETLKTSGDEAIIVGSGSVEYKTIHNSVRNFITVSPAE